jgi:type IV secretion system protein VirB10
MSEVEPEEVEVEGERGPAVVARVRNMGTRINQVFAIAVLGLIGGGFLFWYYTGLAARGEAAEAQAKQVTQQKVNAEMKLPPLVRPAPAAEVAEEVSADEEEPEPVDWDRNREAVTPAAVVYAAPVVAPAENLELKRKLGSPVLMHPGVASLGLDGGAEGSAGPGTTSGGPLAASLVPTMTPGTVAAVLPGQRFLLPKGAFVDCTLETAIDSTLPGMTSCVTAVDVFGADGRVVLIERGTKLVGETSSAVRSGQRRVFVLWNEARTPSGVVASLASPGTDALGRSGVTGEVDTHFAERFGAAILLSVLDAATVALVNAQQDSGSTVVVSPQGSSEVVAEVIKSTVDVPPTIRVAQGTRIQVFVARDVDFSKVYALRKRSEG